MSVREYIGARYVPLFMGEWSDETTYEPLSIVQYQGNSYTSRQYVPTGISITNTLYWANTGNYNAQIEQYRQEVEGLVDSFPIQTASIADDAVTSAKIADENITTAKIADENVTTAKIADDAVTSAKIADENVTTAKIADENVTTAKIADENVTTAKIADENVTTAKIADANVTTAKIADESVTIPKISFRKRLINRFTGTHALWCGDSWGMTGNHGVTTPFMTIAAAKLGIENFENLSVGASGFIQGTTHLTKLQNWVANSDNDPDDVDFIFLFGSSNDYASDLSDISTAVSTCVTYCNTTFPNANVILVPTVGGCDISKASVAINTNNPWTHTHKGIIEAYKALDARCELVSGCLNVMAGIAAYFDLTDFTHPNQQGHNYLASQFAEKLAGGSFKTVLSSEYSDTMSDNKNMFQSYIANSTTAYTGTYTSSTVRALTTCIDDLVTIAVQAACQTSASQTFDRLNVKTPFGVCYTPQAFTFNATSQSGSTMMATSAGITAVSGAAAPTASSISQALKVPVYFGSSTASNQTTGAIVSVTFSAI